MAALGASKTVIVVTGGDPVPAGVLARLPEDATVVAADSGLDHARDLGLDVGLVVGDLDSVDPATLEAAIAAGTVVERHPEAKDSTDLELALDAAERLGATHLVVLGGHGGRLDHLLANALLLADPRRSHLEVVAHMGEATVTVVRGWATLVGAPGELVSLLAVHGVASRVTTEGLLYPLDAEDLLPGSTRGVSNELVGNVARVSIDAGVVLAVQPGRFGTHHLSTEHP